MKETSLLDLRDRLLNNIEIVDDCWIWQGAKNNHGYGLIKISNLEGDISRKTNYVHRMSYLCHNGTLPSDKLVCHSCDTPLCINPNHLFLGTHQENMDDMKSKGRSAPVVPELNYGNNYAGKAVMADGMIYRSYAEAGRKLGITGNAVKKRINRGMDGYKIL